MDVTPAAASSAAARPRAVGQVDGGPARPGQGTRPGVHPQDEAHQGAWPAAAARTVRVVLYGLDLEGQLVLAGGPARPVGVAQIAGQERACSRQPRSPPRRGRPRSGCRRRGGPARPSTTTPARRRSRPSLISLPPSGSPSSLPAAPGPRPRGNWSGRSPAPTLQTAPMPRPDSPG